MYKFIAPGKVLLDYGPISMVIEAYRKGKPKNKAAVNGVEEAIRQFEKLTKLLITAKILSSKLKPDNSLPEVLNIMICKTKATREFDITPMAAVAGAIADMVKKKVLKSGADRVYVNNGGDIALHIEPGGNINVGIVSDLNKGKVTHYINLKATNKVGGIATSGYGGRSLTKGIASSAVIFSDSAAQADACATMVANATTVKSKNIILKKAEEIDPLTDIKGQFVISNVKDITETEITQAVENGKKKFSQYLESGLVKKGVIVVKDITWMYPEKDFIKVH